MAATAQTAPDGGQMNAKVLIEKSSPMTQTEALGGALVPFPGLLPEELPARVLLAGGEQLTPNSKCDKYYLAISRGCICQAARDVRKPEAA